MKEKCKFIWTAIFFAALLPPCFAVAQQNGKNAETRTVVLKQGTVVKLQLVEGKPNSQFSHINDPVKFKVTDDVSAGDAVVIKKETMVDGKVSLVKGSKSRGRTGMVEITLSTVAAIDGTEVMIGESEIFCSVNIGATNKLQFKPDGIFSNEILNSVAKTATNLFSFGLGKGSKVEVPRGAKHNVEVGEDIVIRLPQ
jgi:hypothetical protein